MNYSRRVRYQQQAFKLKAAADILRYTADLTLGEIVNYDDVMEYALKLERESEFIQSLVDRYYTRYDHLFQIVEGPWYEKLWKKLGSEEKQHVYIFVSENFHLDNPQWEMAVNRMYLDREKPKFWKEASEILSTLKL